MVNALRVLKCSYIASWSAEQLGGTLPLIFVDNEQPALDFWRSHLGESQGRGSLVGCRLWGHTESDMIEAS